jgi:hypothetical protein
LSTGGSLHKAIEHYLACRDDEARKAVDTSISEDIQVLLLFTKFTHIFVHQLNV